MEPRAAVGEIRRGDAALHDSCLQRRRGALEDRIAQTLDIPEAAVRVVMRDVGGNFGTRGAIYPEFVLVAWAARRVGRPVKWTCERQRSACSATIRAATWRARPSSRSTRTDDFWHARVNVGNLGALTANFSMVQKGVEIMSSIYRMPAAHFRARCVLSNTAPTRPYRSAGRPEVMYVMERLIDIAARQFGFDRVELRRRNLRHAAGTAVHTIRSAWSTTVVTIIR